MKKSSPSSRSDSSVVTSLFDRVANIVESARGRVLRAVNRETVTTYWLIGREIVQMLQGGEARVQYGKLAAPGGANEISSPAGSELLQRKIQRELALIANQLEF